MTKNDLIKLFNDLNALGALTGVKFSYAVAKNLAILKPEVESLQKSIDMTEEYKAYDAKRIELAKSMSKKDDKGEALTRPSGENSEYVIEDEDAFEAEFTKLKAENQGLIDQRKQQFEEFNALLKEDINPALHKVKLEYIPKEISAAQMNSIIDIVEE